MKLSDKLRRYANPPQDSTMQDHFLEAADLLDQQAKRIAELEGQKKEWLYGALVKRNAVLAEQVEELESAIAAFRDAWENDDGSEGGWDEAVLSTRSQMFDLVGDKGWNFQKVKG